MSEGGAPPGSAEPTSLAKSGQSTTQSNTAARRASKPGLIEILVIAIVCGPPLGSFWLMFFVLVFNHYPRSLGEFADVLRSFVTAAKFAPGTVPGVYAIGIMPALVGAFGANFLFGLRGSRLLRVAGLAVIGAFAADLPLLFLAAVSPPLFSPNKLGPYLLLGATGAAATLSCYLLWWLGHQLRPRRKVVN
jgi:hypothetical protein